jgi:protein gp37
MFRDKKRYGQDPDTVIRSKPPTFNLPNKLKGPALVFVCSWSDFFIEEADAWRDEAWDIIRNNPKLTFQILTKRPENIADRLPADWPLPNVYLGVTVENQEMADKRIPILLNTPAVFRFVSVEPMLGPVDLSGYTQQLHLTFPSLDYVICGGESGPDARPMQGNWPLELQQQCAAADVPFLFKQWSAPKEGHRLGGKEYLDRMPMV